MRKQFLKKVLRKSEGNLQSHWSRMIFSGKATPPENYESEEEIKNLIAKNVNMIGYIALSNADDSVRVVNLN